MKKLIIALLLAVFLSPTAFAGTSAKDVQKVINEAETLRKEAAKLHFEWRDTKKQIKKAQALLKEGKLDKAMKVAKHARLEGQRAIEQAKRESTHYKDLMP